MLLKSAVIIVITWQFFFSQKLQFLSSISGQTHEFIIYAMRQRASEDNFIQFVIVKSKSGHTREKLSKEPNTCFFAWALFCAMKIMRRFS